MASLIDLQNFKNEIDGYIRTLEFSMTADDAATAGWSFVSRLLHQTGPLKIYGSATSATLDETNQTITYEGYADNTLKVFQRPNEYIKAELSFSIDDADNKQCTIKLQPVSTYTLPDSFSAIPTIAPYDILNTIVFEQVVLTISSNALIADDTTLQLHFEGDLLARGPYASLRWLFEVTNPKASGTIDLLVDEDRNLLPVIGKGTSQINAGFADLSTQDWGYLPGLHFDISTRIYSTYDAAEKRFLGSAEILSTFQKEGSHTTIPLVMQLYGEGQGLLTFYVDTDRPLPDLSGQGAENSDKLDAYGMFLDKGSPKDVFGGTNISFGDLSLERLAFTLNPSSRTFSDIQLGISLGTAGGWSILDGKFALEKIAAYLYIGDPTRARDSMNITLQSIFKIGGDNGVDVYANIDLPSQRFNMGLWDGYQIDIISFLRHFAHADDLLEKQDNNKLAITQLNLSGDIPNKQYTLTSTASGNIEIIKGFNLEKIRFRAGYAAGAIDLFFSGDFLMSIDSTEVPLFIEAHKDGDDQWDFAGGTRDAVTFNISKLTQSIAADFDGAAALSPPNTVTDLSIDALRFGYNQGSQKTSFITAGSLTLDETKQEVIQASIEIVKENLAFEFAGSLMINERAFEVDFGHEKDNTLLVASYHKIGGDDLVVKAIIGSFSEELAALVPGNIKITLKDAFFIWDKDAGISKYALGIDIGADFSFHELPLIGRTFTGSLDAGVNNLQVLVANTAFTAQEVNAINALLPEGVHPLPTKAANGKNDANNPPIKKGVNIRAELKFGLDVRTLSMPVGDESEGTTPSTPSSISTDSAPNDSTTPVTTAETSKAKWFQVQKKVGPIYFDRVGVQFNPKKESIAFLLDSNFSLGGLTISLDGLSVSSPLTNFHPSFDLKGLGIDYHNAALEIGAAFLRETVRDPKLGTYTEYDGMAILKMEEFSLGAIGSYAKINGHPSLFIFATMDAPIVIFPEVLTITGLSAGFGYNRALRMPKSANQVLQFPLVAEAMQGETLPPQAGKADLATELEKIHQYIPPAIGQMFLAMGINFNTFELVDTSVLLVASFGQRFELDVLGVSTLVAPPAEEGGAEDPVAFIQLAIVGAVVPSLGIVTFKGVLTPRSFVLSKDCHLTGGFAVSSWSKGPLADDFVMTVGGYHPLFNKPAHYPSVPRLGFNWAIDSNTHLKGDMYFALCAHALMAGGHLEATYHSGNLRAWFKMGVDFLVLWKPYHYDISLYIDLGASYTYHFFGTHHITVDLGADLHLWGPEFGGHADIHIWVVSISVDFGDQSSRDLIPIVWKAFRDSFLPKQTDKWLTVNVSKGLVSQGNDNGHLGVINAKDFVINTGGAIPSKEMVWGSQAVTTTWNNDWGIAPMAKSAGDVSSKQTVTVRRKEGGTWQDYTSNLQYRTLTKNVPAAMWGTQLSHKLNDGRFIDNVFGGLEITAMEPTPGISRTVDRDFVQYETSTMDDAFSWETRTSYTGQTNENAKNIINDSIASNNTFRNDILTALGIGDATIDLNETVANDYILNPQVEDLVAVTPA